MTQDDITRRLDILEEGLKLCGLTVQRRLEAAVQLHVNTEHTGIFCTLSISRDGYWVVIYGAQSARVPEANRHVVAELIARINQNYVVGGFDLDFADGELRYRAGHALLDEDPTHALVDRLVAYTVNAWNRCHVALMSVAYGDVTPEVAIARMQAREASEDPAPTESGDADDDEPDADIDTVLEQLGLA